MKTSSVVLQGFISLHLRDAVAFQSPILSQMKKSVATFSAAKIKPVQNVNRQSFALHSIAREISVTNDIEIVEDEERYLFRRIQTFKDSNKDKPSEEEFTTLIEKWLLFPQPKRAESILDRMEELYTPSGRLYEKIINAWSFGSTECNDRLTLIEADNSEDDDEETIEMRAKERKILRDNAVYCSDRAMDLLGRMEQLCDEIGDDFRPALSTYTSVVNSVLRSSDDNIETFAARREAVERIKEKRDKNYDNDSRKIHIHNAGDVFKTLKFIDNNELYEKFATIPGKPLPIANRYNFNLIINALAQTKKAWAARACEDILDYMIREHVEFKSLTPSIETINGCINAWARCTSETDSAAKAEAILEKLNLAQTTSGLLNNVVPDNVSYNTIIRANGANAERAEAILDTMTELYESTGDEKIKPDIISYSSVLNAYAKAASHDINSSSKSEEILNKMVKMQEKEETGILINTWCFNTVLNAYAVQGGGSRASSLLNLMETMAETNDRLKPDTYSFNTVLKALANSKEKGSVERARSILEKMENKYANGDDSAKPDAITYNTVILAYGNNGGKDAGKRAKSILTLMENRFKGGDLDVRPTSSTYTALIKAFNWERESTRLSEELVDSLKQNPASENGLIRPDTAIYNALLNTWSKSGSRYAVQRAEEIFAEMKETYEETGNASVQPNSRTYTTLIDTLAKSGGRNAPSRCLEVLEEMENLSEKGKINAKPNVYTYTAVISCIARSRDKEKAVQAVSVLQRMEEEYRKGNKSARPNVVAYNSVLNACAYTPGGGEAIETAFKIACLVFDEIRTSCHVKPTHVSYGTFLCVCANLMPESEVRDNLVEATFKRCARDGLVSKMVWRNLSNAASPTLLGNFLEQANSGSKAHWSRNV